VLTSAPLVAFPRTLRAVELCPVGALSVAAALPTVVTVARHGHDLGLAWVAAALLGAAAGAYAVDDDAAAVLASSPTPLSWRRAARVMATACPVLIAWVVVVVVSVASGRWHDVPLVLLAVEALTVLGVSIAVAGQAGGMAGMFLGVVALLVVSVLSVQYPWLPRVGDPVNHDRFLLLALAAWVAVAWSWRDPARRSRPAWRSG
jgi:hypothetical protein